MVLLGLLLIVVAAAALIEVSVNDAATTTPMTFLDWTFNLSPFELFLLGAATSAVFLIGLVMVSGGMRRSATRRRRLREERLAERDRVSRLESEKRDLERKLESERSDTTSTDTTSTDAAARVPEQRTTTTHDRDGDGVDDDTRPVDRVTSDESDDRLVAGGRHAAAARRRDESA